jgi:hypothetical protein
MTLNELEGMRVIMPKISRDTVNVLHGGKYTVRELWYWR